ncbi:MAG: Smr/MutS family protein [Anaerolineales bacterium]|nr:Smr/MutS family protein [Anaerolineales bacterium]
MDEKTLQLLEYPKILERLASYCAFDASKEMARNLRPTGDIFIARQRLQETSEAVQLYVTHSDLTIGGARDVRGPVDLAQHGGVLTPQELLDIKYTLVSARNLERTFERLADRFPHLCDIVARIPQAPGVIDAIGRTISDHSEILDSASAKLANIRHDLRIVHDRLLSKMQRMISDPKNTPYLQETIITTRDGRYVLPLRSEFKGRIRSIIHDQSSSGATLFVEPLAVVELNNQYRELQLAERDEERRILAELSQTIGSYAFEITHVVEVIAELDLTLARARFAEDLKASEPVLYEIPENNQVFEPRQKHRKGRQNPPAEGEGPQKAENPQVLHPGTVIRLSQARHPLLEAMTVVPIDVELDQQTYAMVVTGPNTGGKTVTLKTIGLLVLMAQSGLHIPAKSGSEISVFETVYADIGDEQSIEQSLSTFSGHITNIIRILSQADRRSLVILDELGAGTDPQEGAALARALLDHLLARSVTTLVTTHHPELKAYAHATPGVVNACVEFDLETLRPTYRLTIGLPGQSNALSIAQRLGLPLEIIEDARRDVSPDELRADSLLREIHRQREIAHQARAAVEKSHKEADQLSQQLSRRLETIEEERSIVLEQARQEAAAQLADLQVEIAEARRQIARLRQPVSALQPVEEKLEELQEAVEQPVVRRAVSKKKRSQPSSSSTRSGPLQVGEKVCLRRLNMQGVVTSLSGDEAEVQVGILRVRAQKEDLQRLGDEEEQIEEPETLPGRKRKNAASTVAVNPPERREISLPVSPGIELDLRGQRADEALEALERYLDAATLAGLPFARIIHGKGSGKLREVVRQALSGHAQVRSFEAGSEKEGGEGVTVVKL